MIHEGILKATIADNHLSEEHHGTGTSPLFHHFEIRPTDGMSELSLVLDGIIRRHIEQELGLG